MIKYFCRPLFLISVFMMGVISNASAASVNMVEFYLPSLDYYFVTSRSPEIASLDALPDWQRTGKSFTVLSEATSGTVPISRFFFPEVAKRSTRGSHFYTLADSDRAALRGLNPSNAYARALPLDEKVDSYAYAPLGELGSAKCPIATVPVYRSFRGAAYSPDDGNHRFTTDLDIYATMTTMGWTPEGIAFCAVDQQKPSSLTPAVGNSLRSQVVLAPGVVVLTGTRDLGLGRIELPNDGQSVSVGSVILADGLVYKIVSFSATSPSLIVNVERPLASEVFTEITMTGDVAFTAAQFVPSTLMSGMKITSISSPAFSSFDSGKFSTTPVRNGIRLTGDFALKDVKFSGSVDVTAQFKFNHRATALAVNSSVDVDAHIGVELSAIASIGITPKPVEILLGDFFIPIAGTLVAGVRVPVYLRLALEKAEVAASLTYGGAVEYGFSAVFDPAVNNYVVTPRYTNSFRAGLAAREGAAGFASAVNVAIEASAGLRIAALAGVAGLSDAGFGVDVGATLIGTWVGRVQSNPLDWCKDEGAALELDGKLVAKFFWWEREKPFALIRYVIDPQDPLDRCPALAAPPVVEVTRVSPLSGLQGQRISVSVRGNNLPSNYAIQIGNQNVCSAVALSSTNGNFTCDLNTPGNLPLVVTSIGSVAIPGGTKSFVVTPLTKVDDISPKSAVVGERAVVAFSGIGLHDGMSLVVNGCSDYEDLGGTALVRRIACVPRLAGNRQVVVRNVPDGQSLFAGLIDVTAQSGPINPSTVATVQTVSPTIATLGVPTTFTVVGQKLFGGWRFSFEGCTAVTEGGGDQSQRTFRCTPMVAGNQRARLYAPDGSLKYDQYINVIAATSVNRAPSVTFDSVASPIALGQPFSGSVSAVDPDGNQLTRFRIRVVRAADNGSCEFDVGAAYTATQAAGTKTFAGCSNFSSQSGSYSLRAEVWDYVNGDAGLQAVAAIAAVTVVAAATTVYPAPTQLSPNNGAVLTGTAVTISWSNTGAPAYDIGLSVGGVLQNIALLNSTSYSFTAVAGKTYTWDIASCSANTSYSASNCPNRSGNRTFRVQ